MRVAPARKPYPYVSLDKFLSLLVYPLGCSLLLGGAALLLGALRRRRLAAALGAVALAWLLLWSLPPVADAVGRSLEAQSQHLPVATLPRADVILVFGGVVRPAAPDHPYPDLSAGADRAWHAARLYHAGRAPLILLSGGVAPWQRGRPSEAAAMAQLLQELGVPRSALLLEEQSLTTRQNAVQSSQAMQTAGLHRALLVTSALHMPRALAAARAAGIDAQPAATDFLVVDSEDQPLRWLPTAAALQRSTDALHEWIGLAVYRWRGWQ